LETGRFDSFHYGGPGRNATDLPRRRGSAGAVSGPYAQPSWDRQYDVAPDGRFLLMRNTAGSPRERIAIVPNWFEELKRRVPIK